MGSRLFANATGLFAGRDFLNPAHCADVARILGIPENRISQRNSLAYDQIIERARDGRIKGLWIIGTNPSHSWIGQDALNDTLRKLEFLVVQDAYTTTETARHAHMLLPAAAWGEKEGTFINSERRIGLAKKISRSPGAALADFHIFRLIAHYWGCGNLFQAWTSPQAVFQILKQLSAGTPCDFTGVDDYRHLDSAGGIQWPWPLGAVESHDVTKAPNRERRLFENGRFFHADGKARFVFDQPRELPEKPDAEFPFVLLTGRGTTAQWHTLTRTNKSEILRKLSPAELQVEVHPHDAKALGVRSGSRVSIASRRATIEAIVLVTATVQQGQVYLPMHDSATNKLTFPAFDAHSRQPSYKFCAVRLASLSRKRK
jgi:assimilatory nitrate reductase catalytic subunit